MRVTRILGLALVAASTACPALADFQVREVCTDAKGKQLSERTLIVSPSRLRLDQGEVGFIVDVAKGKAVWLDHKAKTWIESPFASPAADPQEAARRAQFETLVSKLEEPGSQRFVPTQETRQIAGVSAKRTDVFIGARKIRERWQAESLPMDDISAIQLKLAELGGASMMQQRYFQELLNTGHLGYPVLIRDYELDVIVEAKEIKKGPQPATLFAVPSGYRKAD